MIPVIAFLTDYGLRDAFVGVCHGVLASLAPEARVIDVTHDVPPGDVRTAGNVLARCAPYLHAGVHLAVVDPSVGTPRRAVVVATGADGLFVGPDNGLLIPAVDRAGGPAQAWQLTNPGYQLQPVSRTFHGRDIFAPAAAHLAGGLPAEELGPELAIDSLVRLPPPTVRVTGRTLHGEVLDIDRFGNVGSSLTARDLAAARLREGERVVAMLGARRVPGLLCAAFADVEPGDLAVLVDSWGQVALAYNGASAAEALSAERGQALSISASHWS